MNNMQPVTIQQWKSDRYGIRYGTITLKEEGQYVMEHDTDTGQCKIIQFIPRGSK